jgi:hypothetical protein
VVGDLCFDACFSQLEPKPPSGGAEKKNKRKERKSKRKERKSREKQKKRKPPPLLVNWTLNLVLNMDKAF